MAENLETMLIRIDASTEAVRRELRRMDGTVGRTEKKTNRALAKIDRGFKNAARSVGGMAAAFVSLRGAQQLVRMGREAISTADEIQKTADKVGLLTNELQEMRYAAELSDVSQSTLDMAMQRFSRRVGEVAQGQGELLKVARQYDVQLRDSSGEMRSNMAILQDFADIIANAESQQEQLRIAFKLFDSEGAALVNLMRRGSAGIEEFRNEAHELSGVLDEELIAKSVEAEDALTKLETQISANMTRAFVALSPEIIAATDNLAAFSEKAADLAKEWQEGGGRRRLEMIADYLRTMVTTGGLGFFQPDSMTDVFGLGGDRRTFPQSAPTSGPSRTPLQEIYARGEGRLKRRIGDPDGAIEAVDEAERLLSERGAAQEMLRDLEIQADRSAGRMAEAIVKSAEAQKKALGSIPGFTAEMVAEAEGHIDEMTRESLDDLNRKIDANQQAMESWLRSVSDGFADAILGAQSLGDALKGLLLQLAKAELSNAIFGSISGKSSGGSIVGGILKNVGLPGFKDGGDTPVNRPFLVGEDGPEIMSFNKSARVTPMSGAPVVNNHYNIQTGLPQQIVAAVRNIATEAGYAGAQRALGQMSGRA